MKRDKIRVLAVCTWPVGGIRTYLKYVYRRFPFHEFDITLIAKPGPEKLFLESDLKGTPMRLVWAEGKLASKILSYRIAAELARRHYDLIHSHGFISAFHASVPNRLYRKRHVLTIHGILEDKYLSGRFALLKRNSLKWALKDVSVFHGVGEEILEHVRERTSGFACRSSRWVVILNGIEAGPFLTDDPGARANLHGELQLSAEAFVFGFFGRFMPQKGFDLVIQAVRKITGSRENNDFVVLAVGSGDYEKAMKRAIATERLEKYFRFLPHRTEISGIMQGCDAVLMPSNWEAFGLVAAECLCAGVPLIASKCIGLREVISGTPALAIAPGDYRALAEAMVRVQEDLEIRLRAQTFRPDAAKRFDVQKSADGLIDLFRQVVESH